MIEQNAKGLRVTGPMLIANASALLEAGRGFLSAGALEVELDLSAVEETDSSALSVIFGLLRSARERGVTMRIAHPPASMVSQAALYGVSESLPLA
jgi:phospholipid transport system transporter-binding protein